MLARVLVPVFGVLATIAAARFLSVRHPDEPWIGKFLVLAVMAKEFASILRYRTLVNSYGDVGDASVFSTLRAPVLRLLARARRTSLPTLDNIRKSNFLRWFTGVVYYLFGTDMIAGFMVFGLIAFVGSYLWYRAAVRSRAVPRQAALLPDRHVRAEHPLLAVVDRQGSVDAVRDRQCRARNRAPLQRQALTRHSSWGYRVRG